MEVLNDAKLRDVIGGDDLPIAPTVYGPSDSYIASILALLAPKWPVHPSD